MFNIKNQKDEKKDYALVAFTFQERVVIFGKSLEEICQMYRDSIEKTKRPDLKAIEMGRYAVFILEQSGNFGNCEYAMKQGAVDLLNCAVIALLDDPRKTYWNSPVLATFQEKWREGMEWICLWKKKGVA